MRSCLLNRRGALGTPDLKQFYRYQLDLVQAIKMEAKRHAQEAKDHVKDAAKDVVDRA